MSKISKHDNTKKVTHPPQNILITGASDGIGKALAYEMASRGYNLGLCARRQGALTELKKTIQAQYPACKIAIEALDVTHYGEVEPAFERINKHLGTLDIVAANAGIARAGKAGKIDLADEFAVIDTNVKGAIACIHAALRIFRAQGYGHIVGTSSVAAYRGMPRNGAYCASKAALTTYLEAVRAETKNEHIDVSIIHPGYIDTEINRSLSSRPFVINVEKGAKLFADMIEAKIPSAALPRMPWSLVGPALKLLPTSVISKM